MPGLVPKPVAIKIDVEGGERDVCAGLSTLLSTGTVRLVFEGDEQIARQYGYSDVRRLSRNESTEHALDNYVAEGWSSTPLANEAGVRYSRSGGQRSRPGAHIARFG